MNAFEIVYIDLLQHVSYQTGSLGYIVWCITISAHIVNGCRIHEKENLVQREFFIFISDVILMVYFYVNGIIVQEPFK